MNRSIDLLEELALASGNAFQLNRRGYLYVTADSNKIPEIQRGAEKSSQLGGGPLRIQRGSATDPQYAPNLLDQFSGAPSGADLILDQKLIRKHFPYLSPEVVAALHVRRAGWFSAHQLGSYLLEKARAHGVQLLEAKVSSIEIQSGRVRAVNLEDGRCLPIHSFVNAAGPYLKSVGQMLGVELPVYCELHLKVAFKDHQGIVPREAPLLIWLDSQFLPWSSEERDLLSADPETRWLLEEFPPGVHTRPEGPTDSPIALMLWEYSTKAIEPIFPPPLDLDYPEIAMRGLAKMLPGLSSYFEKPPRPILDGGYYTKTGENRPLIGPLPTRGSYVIGALSGYGLMASMAAGELLAAYLAGTALPRYSAAFSLERYQDPAYQALLEDWGESGQL
jgi:glycine/D-amino acid oxidase-like deaminating enzyme